LVQRIEGNFFALDAESGKPLGTFNSAPLFVPTQSRTRSTANSTSWFPQVPHSLYSACR